jgi:hypothetical protein
MIPGEPSHIHRCDLVDHLRQPGGLRVEGHGHVQPDSRELENFTPKIAGECRIMVADDGARQAMKLNDVREECACHRCHCRGGRGE